MIFSQNTILLVKGSGPSWQQLGKTKFRFLSLHPTLPPMIHLIHNIIQTLGDMATNHSSPILRRTSLRAISCKLSHLSASSARPTSIHLTFIEPSDQPIHRLTCSISPVLPSPSSALHQNASLKPTATHVSLPMPLPGSASSTTQSQVPLSAAKPQQKMPC